VRDQGVSFGGEERLNKSLDRLRRLSANELGDDLAVLERLDGGNPLDAERACKLLIAVRVDLGQLDLATLLGDGALKDRPQLTARSTPLSPEINNDGNFL